MAIFEHAKIMIRRRTNTSLIRKRDSFSQKNHQVITLKQIFQITGDDFFISNQINQDTKILAPQSIHPSTQPDFESFERIDKEDGIGLLKTHEEDWDNEMMPSTQEMGVEPLSHYGFLASRNRVL